MVNRIFLSFALAALAGADSGCADTGTCEDVHEVSLLQTELKVSKTNKGVSHHSSDPSSRRRKDSTTEKKKTTKEKKTGGQLTSGDMLVSAVAAPSLLLAATMIHMQFETFKKGSDFPKYVAEFIGTFMLVFSVGCNVLIGSSTWGVTSIASTLMVSIYALGGVSGGNFNPAVSVALGLAGKMQWATVAIYVCVQWAAGICAALGYGLMLGQTFNLGPKGVHTWMEAGGAELLYTFMLTFVVLNVAATKAHADNQFYGLAIGFTVVAGGYGAGSISGGCFNPAIALAIDISSLSAGYGMSLIYMAFEFVGCAIAAFMFRTCRPEEVGEAEAQEGVPRVEGPDMKAKLTSEFLGTYMLVLTVGLNVLNKSKGGVLSIAASLMCMIFALGSVSGAHFNPAVTVAIRTRGLISNREVLFYTAVQVFGALCAGITTTMLMFGQTVPLQPGDKASLRQALMGEFVFTFLLAFVVLCVATTEKGLSEFFGLAIGACVIAGGYAIGSLSGGSLNPAVSAGLAITDQYNGGPIVNLFSYFVVEILAGVTAGLVFGVTHPAEVTKS